MKFGERVEAARREAGLSREALAVALSTSERQIRRWECGETMPTIGNAVAIAEALGVSLEWLAVGRSAA